MLSNLLTVVMVYVPGISETYRSMFTVPNLVLSNALACRVFRNARFGVIREGTSFIGDSVAIIPLANMPRRPQRVTSDSDPETLQVSKVINHVSKVDFNMN